MSSCVALAGGRVEFKVWTRLPEVLSISRPVNRLSCSVHRNRLLQNKSCRQGQASMAKSTGMQLLFHLRGGISNYVPFELQAADRIAKDEPVYIFLKYS